jgi:hypothetical protein
VSRPPQTMWTRNCVPGHRSTGTGSSAVPASRGPSCVLFDKSVVGWTMRRAVFQSQRVGGSPGEREQYASGHPEDPAGYDAFWNCTGYARS